MALRQDYNSVDAPILPQTVALVAPALLITLLFSTTAYGQPFHEQTRSSVGILHTRSLYPTAAATNPLPSFLPTTTAQNGGLSRTGLLEMSAAALTGAGHLATSELRLSYLFIPAATAGWSAYAFHEARSDPAFGRRVGFTRHDLGPAFRNATLFSLGAGALMAGYAALNDSLYVTPNMVPSLLLYPAWGLIQQFLVQGMFTRNLDQAHGALGSPYVVVPASALLFGAVHLPNLKLAAATFGMGLAFTPLYLEHRNLWPLGLYHGALGVLFYYWVLQRDPMRYLSRNPRSSRFQVQPALGPDGAPGLQLQVKL